MKRSYLVRLTLVLLLIGGACERPQAQANVPVATSCLLAEMQKTTAIWSSSYDESQELADATLRVPEEHRHTVFEIVSRTRFNNMSVGRPSPRDIVAAAEEISKSLEGISWDGWRRDIAILYLVPIPTKQRSAVSDSIDTALEKLNVEDCRASLDGGAQPGNMPE